MKSQFEKYAKLQQTVWPKYATTTLGNLPAEMAKKIDAEYDRVIAIEAKGEKAEITEASLIKDGGEAVNVVTETPRDVGATSDGPASGIKSDLPAATDIQANADVNTDSNAVGVVDSNFGENDENELAEDQRQENTDGE